MSPEKNIEDGRNFPVKPESRIPLALRRARLGRAAIIVRGLRSKGLASWYHTLASVRRPVAGARAKANTALFEYLTRIAVVRGRDQNHTSSVASTLTAALLPCRSFVRGMRAHDARRSLRYQMVC